MSPPPRRAPGDLLVHLRRARDHIDRHYAEPLDLAAVAAVAGISKYHFQRLFTATYGMSPAAHLSRRRIERAQDLLRATNLTVTEVCHAVGFASLGSFSSRFPWPAAGPAFAADPGNPGGATGAFLDPHRPLRPPAAALTPD